MSGQTWWVVVIVAVVVAAVIGFFVGRQSGGARQRVEELESEVMRGKEEIDSYKREVEAHFSRTASLFVSMAGSYRELFEHLSSGYEKLAEGSARDLFKERVTTVLLDASRKESEAPAATAPVPMPDGAPQPASYTTEAGAQGDVPPVVRGETSAVPRSDDDAPTPDRDAPAVAAEMQAEMQPEDTGAGERADRPSSEPSAAPSAQATPAAQPAEETVKQ